MPVNLSGLDFPAVQAHAVHIPKLLGFLDEIGIAWRFAQLDAPTFLPGIELNAGEVLIDPQRFKYPGDILHEAGHVALAPPEIRDQLQGDIGAQWGDSTSPELGVLAWTYAAAVHLGIDPQVVFHADGYRDDSDMIADTISSGSFMGQPLLAWMGLCGWQGIRTDIPLYPVMTAWLRTSP